MAAVAGSATFSINVCGVASASGFLVLTSLPVDPTLYVSGVAVNVDLETLIDVVPFTLDDEGFATILLPLTSVVAGDSFAAQAFSPNGKLWDSSKGLWFLISN